MTDYVAFIPYVNRPDLLQTAVHSAYDLWGNLTVLNNSKCDHELRLHPRVRPYTPPVPLTFTQSQNYFINSAVGKNADIIIWLHSDAEALSGSCLRLLELARKHVADETKWGCIFTNYDSMAAYSVKAFKEISGWDTNFSQYYSDVDVYRRIRLAGYECINTDIPVNHNPSQTIKSDPELNFINGITFPLFSRYYEQKWGGPPHQETYLTPFNR